MQITDVVTRRLSWSLDRTQINPQFAWDTKDIVLVFIMTDTGLVGHGEAWASGGTPRALMATIEDDIKPALIGADPRHIAKLVGVTARDREISGRRGITKAAISAIDIALWDILGQITNQPLYALLGGYSNRCRVYASAGLYGPDKSVEDLAQEMRGYVDQGFRAVKLKVGGAPLEIDVQRVRAVREAIGPDLRIMVDAVGSLRRHGAVQLAERIRPFDIYWFEQPVPSADIASQAAINATAGIPVAGNENLTELEEYRRLLEAEAVQFAQFDVTLAGGVTDGVRVAAIAQSWHRPVTIHHASSIVGMLASLHLGAALPNCDSVEFHFLHQWLFDRVPPGVLEVQDSYVTLPETAGLGLALRPEDLVDGDCRPPTPKGPTIRTEPATRNVRRQVSPAGRRTTLARLVGPPYTAPRPQYPPPGPRA